MSNTNHKKNIEIFGGVVVGPKGQIVIPKDIRSQLNIQSGDRLISVIADEKYIGFARAQDCDIQANI